jgi:hypothetical protein
MNYVEMTVNYKTRQGEPKLAPTSEVVWDGASVPFMKSFLKIFLEN